MPKGSQELTNSRKDEIMAQHNSIGIPSEGELKSSPNAVWVESYTREDGTEVRGYWRSKPEGSAENTSNDNVKRDDITTDEQGTVTGGASIVNNNVLRWIYLFFALIFTIWLFTQMLKDHFHNGY